MYTKIIAMYSDKAIHMFAEKIHIYQDRCSQYENEIFIYFTISIFVYI
jgi:hypothetical protein